MGTRSIRAPLTRARILRAALALADAEGLEAVSMRRVGEALGVEAMSLYNHVANKAALLAGIQEMVLADMGPPRPREGSWASQLKDEALALRAALLAHPATLPLFASRPLESETSLSRLEASLSILLAAGVAPLDALGIVQCATAMVVGHVLREHGARTATVPDYDALDPARYPAVRAVARVLARHDPTRELVSGLEALFAGVAAGGFGGERASRGRRGPR